MGARCEAFAKQFEAKVLEASAAIEKISDADWKKVTEAEKWPVGVTAHHVAWGHEVITGIFTTVAADKPLPHFTMDMLNDMNAKHAQEQVGCTKSETLALHKKNAAAAAAALRSLQDDQLAKSGTVIAGAPAMSVEQIVTGFLLHHIDDHFGSIQKTIGG